MASYPNVVDLVCQRLDWMPRPVEVFTMLPEDFTENLPMIHVTPGGGSEAGLERVEKVTVDVYADYYPLPGQESAREIAKRVHDWLCPVGPTWFETEEGLADEVRCDPVPTDIPYPLEDVALVGATYHVYVRPQ